MLHPIVGTRLRLVPGAWPLDAGMRARADAHWQTLVAANPHLWNGRVLGTFAPGRPGGIVIDDGILFADAVEGDFAAFLAWRDWGFPEIGLRNLFGSALIRSSDGALIYGVMDESTANAGKTYPPGGSLEPSDADAAGEIRLVAAIEREMKEETGLSAADATAGGMFAVFDGPRVSIGRLYDFNARADELVAEIMANLDRQEERELARVIAVRRLADVATADVPDYARSFIEGLLHRPA